MKAVGFRRPWRHVWSLAARRAVAAPTTATLARAMHRAPPAYHSRSPTSRVRLRFRLRYSFFEKMRFSAFLLELE